MDADTFHISQRVQIRISHSLGVQIPSQDPEAWYDLVYGEIIERTDPKYAWC